LAPAAAPVGWEFVSEAYVVSPDDIVLDGTVGVMFTWYDSYVFGHDESTITVFVDTGAGWEPLVSTVDEDGNLASALADEVGSFAILIEES